MARLLFYSKTSFPFTALAVLLLLLVNCHGLQAQSKENILMLQSGRVHFVSDAPLELIEASSNEIRGVIDTVSGQFAFTIPMTSFLGFNSDLQRTHFNENYIESDEYPRATFTGKIIEAWKTPTSEPREVRAKGKLTVHGESVERLIPATIERDGEAVLVKSQFVVPLTDHSIKIPRLVSQKIASEINVDINARFGVEE